VITADVAVILPDATALMTGIVGGPALTVRNSSAGAAHGTDPDTDVQLTPVAVAAVLSHKAIST
jgi:hypothetical protein